MTAAPPQSPSLRSLRVSHPLCLCLLLSLALASAALAQAEAGAHGPEGAPAWEVPARRVELRAAFPPPTAHPVRVSPGTATVLLFDTPLARVEVEGEARFGRVRLNGDTLTL